MVMGLAAILCAAPSMAVEKQDAGAGVSVKAPGFAGSQSCRECHAHFYELWSTSFHGLAMQPFTTNLLVRFTAQDRPIQIVSNTYRVDITNAVVEESGPAGDARYPIQYALGGKNVFYFLTTLDRGRLQTLPLAYDARRKEWFDTALSGMRHFPGQQTSDRPVYWKEWPYTFNTACHACHVSQLSKNYDQKSDTYHTTWKEPGINCETCHGPCEEHNRAMRALPAGQAPKELKLVRTKTFTPAQHNDSCASCHAKASPLTDGYKTPDKFFDHFDLVTLESPDYYPDGRDLGENYTLTSWLLSPCARNSQMSCVTCHTASGRYRFSSRDQADQACLPCHEEQVKNRQKHTHHRPSSSGSQCVACHMPTTEFARMRRTDHSMLPPTPSATIQFKSPNACNSCHSRKDALWADRAVRRWTREDYQAPLLQRAGLIDAARKRDWSRLPEMLTFINDPEANEVFIASLIRLTRSCGDPGLMPALLKAVTHASPLVRGAAAEALGDFQTTDALQALVTAAGDDIRLVRVRAAAALADYPMVSVAGDGKGKIQKATDEYLASLMARPDSWDAHYNMGNFHLGRNAPGKALEEYAIALKHEPESVMAMVNSSIAHARQGDTTQAEKDLLSALRVASNSAPAHFNLALLKAELNDPASAEKHFRQALDFDPLMADAAFNLGVLLNKDHPAEALTWCRKAVTLRPDEPKFGYTLAYYQRQQGDTNGAVSTLREVIRRRPAYGDAYLLLGDIHETAKNISEAGAVYRQAVVVEGMDPGVLKTARDRLARIDGGKESSKN